jgi:hypothetical protein
VVSPVVSQVRLAKVLVDGGSALDIIFASTLEGMGYDMTSLVPSDQAFYNIIPGAGVGYFNDCEINPQAHGYRRSFHL